MKPTVMLDPYRLYRLTGPQPTTTFARPEVTIFATTGDTQARGYLDLMYPGLHQQCNLTRWEQGEWVAVEVDGEASLELPVIRY